jgi:hypothetical protein
MMQAYPFMWAKNKHIHEWCCVARPQFIHQLNGAAKLALLGAQTGTTLGPNEVCVVRGHDPVSGEVLDLFYRRRPSDITDSVGRPVSLIEGFVLRQRDPALVISGEHFDDAQAKLQPMYERFRDATAWTTEASLHPDTIDVRTISSGTPVTIKETNSKRIPPIDKPLPPAKASHVGKGRWNGELSSMWAKPGGRAFITATAIAVVAVGAYAIAESRRRTHSQSKELGR